MNYYFLVIAVVVLAVVLYFIFKKIFHRKKSNLFQDFDKGGYWSEGSFSGMIKALFYSQKQKPKRKIEKDLSMVGTGELIGPSGPVKGGLGQRSGKQEELKGRSVQEKVIKKEEGDLVKEEQIKKDKVEQQKKDLKKSRKKLEAALKKEKKKLKKLLKKEKKQEKKQEKKIKENKQSKQGVEGTGKKEVGIVKKFVAPKKLLSKIKGTSLDLILSSLKKQEYSFIVDKLSNYNFSSSKDLVDALGGELTSLLKDAYKEIRYKLSKLRKAGKKINHLDIKLMSVPLKINIFKATFSNKDFEKVMVILRRVNEALEPFNIEKPK